jgi:hypothetical protein
MVIDQMDEALAAAEESLRLWNEVDDQIRIGAAHIAVDHIAWNLGQAIWPTSTHCKALKFSNDTDRRSS